MITLNVPLLQRLRAIGVSDEGSLFNPMDPRHYGRMIGLIERVLESVYLHTEHPRIIEIGAHRAYFPYVCCAFARDRGYAMPVFDEFDLAPWSARACEAVANEYGAVVRFHLVESNDTIPAFCPDGAVDMLYVDGGHDYRNALSDCQCAARWLATHVLVDDCQEGVEVYRAACDALTENYEEVAAARAGNDCTRWYRRCGRA